MKKFLLSMSVILFFMGCTKEDLQNFSTPEEAEIPDFSRPVEQAMSEVECLVQQLDGETRTDGTHRKIVDYYCCEGSATRSASGDPTQAYVFNFADNEGFAVVAADARIADPVLVLTDNGYLNPEEGIDNPGLIVYLAMAEDYCREQARANISLPDITINPWKVDQYYGRRTYLNWGQREPFNNNIPPIGTTRPPLGCTATATMLLMAWYQYPQVYQGHRYNWAEMLKHANTNTNNGWANSAAESDLARLGELITRPENLNMSFAHSGSGAYISNIPRTLSRLGYFYGGTFAAWNEAVVLDELSEYPNYPVVVSAYALRVTSAPAMQASPEEVPGKVMGIAVSRGVTYDKGHTFLLESAMRRYTEHGKDILGRPVRFYQTLVFVNYGWGDTSNGYYNAGVFNTTIDGGPVTRATEGTVGYYQYNIEMVYGVRI